MEKQSKIYKEHLEQAEKEGIYIQKEDLRPQLEEFQAQIKNEEFRIQYPKKKLTVI